MARPDAVPFEIRLDHPLLAIIARQRAALEAARAGLVMLHGRTTRDGALPGEKLQIDASEALAAIDAALAGTPGT